MNADCQHSNSMNVTDLTTGNLWVKIFRFSIPLIITNLLQAIYNIADMMIVGHYVGKTGMSAVSNGGQVTAVVLCIVLGISNAGAVMVAQLTGAKRGNEVSKLIGTLMVTFVVIAVVLTIIVYAAIKTELLLLLRSDQRDHPRQSDQDRLLDVL